MTCCAADARAIRVAVPGGRSFPADTWVAVTGTYAGLEAHAVPVLRAGSAEPVPAPGDFSVGELELTPFSFFPGEHSASKLSGTLHEYIGLINYNWRVRFSDP